MAHDTIAVLIDHEIKKNLGVALYSSKHDKTWAVMG